ncbi:hypothetical protein N7530_001695 [Penicillium desertorum]|uniref:Major facilitator superfamily (MFS) profile domain-containing protein n=1 Tax=Penicillium desertorum TaxID=1303715 RepID=A0A9X0BX49_9EURO|nr:hypothetical protein N7530_001695 [Penicillium desertorum]
MASLGAKLRFVITAGVGFFADGYLNLTIGLVVPILGYLYFQDGKVPTVNSDIMKGGQSLGMSCCLGTGCRPSLTAWIAVFRVVTGVGTGADYPLSSSLSAEKPPFGSRAIQVLTVFSNIGLGNTAASVVFLILLKAFEDSIANNLSISNGSGVCYWALELYQQHVYDDTSGKKRTFKKQWEDFCEYFSHWKHAKVLLATTGSWFFDIAYYGINLNQSIILARIGYANGATTWQTLYNTAVGNIIIQAAGYLPGFYVGIFLPDRIGRRCFQRGFEEQHMEYLLLLENAAQL